ncbi:hypothetical protein D0864_09912 [Hortaea werneckii]|uniref:Uncharacterized protein n=1 Tax=Hortaea werneckii TaxID=91943 RepID=A0A3M7EE89_HORWE|nr:hypothetical protein D0864_09912 [Hortaea werneckii]
MSSGHDELVQHLLYEVALSGSHGFGVQELKTAAHNFYHVQNGQSLQQRPSQDEGDLLFSDAPPTSVAVVDDALIETVWAALCRHDDIEVANTKSDSDHASDSNATPSTSTVAGAQHADERLFATEERMWHAIAGHGIDTKRIPYLEFQCLSVIAAHGRTGVLQPDITRITGQQKQSVPKRTQNLADKGYVTKKSVLATGTKTSLLTLKKFEEKSSDLAIAPQGVVSKQKGPQSAFSKDSTGRLIIDYDKWFDASMALLQEQPNQLLAIQDLRLAFNIHKKKYETRCLMRCIRRLARQGCLRKLSAKATNDEGHLLNSKEVRCIQLTREPTASDKDIWKKVDKAERHRSSGLIDGELTMPSQLDGGDDVGGEDAGGESEIEMIENDQDEEEGLEDRGNLAHRQLPQWRADMPLPNLLYSIIEEAGADGISSVDLNTMIAGNFLRRPLDEQMARLTDIWQFSQPPHLRHLAVVRDTSTKNKSTFYHYRTFPNFEQAVENGWTVWSAIQDSNTRTLKGQGTYTTAPSATSQETDQWGFPKPVLSQFVGGDGRASLADAAKHARRMASGVSLPREDGSQATPGRVAKPGRRVSIHPAKPSQIESGDFELQTNTNRTTPRVLKRPRIAPEKDNAEFKDWASKTAKRIVRAQNPDVGRSEEGEPPSKRKRRDDTASIQPEGDDESLLVGVRSELLSKSRPGVYINPPGSRDLKAQWYFEVGRPKTALIAVFKSNRLHEFEFFKDPEQATPSAKRSLSRAGAMEQPAGPPSKRPRHESIPEKTNVTPNPSDHILSGQSDAKQSSKDQDVGDNTSASPLVPAPATTATLSPAPGPKFDRAYVFARPSEEFHHVGRGMYRRGPPPTKQRKKDSTVQSKISVESPARPLSSSSKPPTDMSSNTGIPNADDDSRQEMGRATSNGDATGTPSTNERIGDTTEVDDLTQAPGETPVGSSNALETPRPPTEDIVQPAGSALTESIAPPPADGNLSTAQRSSARNPVASPLAIVRPYGTPVTTPTNSAIARLQSSPHKPQSPRSPLAVFRPYYGKAVQSDVESLQAAPAHPQTNSSIQTSEPPMTPTGDSVQEQIEDNVDSNGNESSKGASVSMPAPSTDNQANTTSLAPGQFKFGKRQNVKAGTRPRAGNVVHQRTNLIFDVLDQCNGVFPGNREIWYPFATLWFKLYSQTPDRRTVDQSVKTLVDTGKLKKLTFTFQSDKGENVTRSVLTLPEIESSSELVDRMKQAIITAHPIQHLPDDADISAELRARVANHPQAQGKQQSVGMPVFQQRHYREEFPSVENFVVQRTKQSIDLYNAAARAEGWKDATERSLAKSKENSRLALARLKRRQMEMGKSRKRKAPSSDSDGSDDDADRDVDGRLPNGDDEYVPRKKTQAKFLRRVKRKTLQEPGSRMFPVQVLPRSILQNLSGRGVKKLHLALRGLVYHAPTGTFGSRDVWLPGVLEDDYEENVRSQGQSTPKSKAKLGDDTTYDRDYVRSHPEIQFYHKGRGRYKKGERPAKPSTEVQAQSITVSVDEIHSESEDDASPGAERESPPSTSGTTSGLASTTAAGPASKVPEKPREPTFNKAYVQAHPQEAFYHVGAGRYRRGTSNKVPRAAARRSSTLADSPDFVVGASATSAVFHSPSGTFVDAVPQLGQTTYQKPVRWLSPGASRSSAAPVYKSRRRDAVDNHSSAIKAKQWFKAGDLRDLVIALSMVKTLCGGLSQMRLNWEIVAHSLAFKYDAETLRLSWAQYCNAHIEEVDGLREKVRGFFLKAYERGELPTIDFSDLSNSDWPALFQWWKKQAQTQRRKNRVTFAPAPERFQSTDLPASVAALHDQYAVQVPSGSTMPENEGYFSGKVESARNMLAQTILHGISSVDTSTRLGMPDNIALLKSWCRAVAATPDDVYNAELAAGKLGVFDNASLQKAMDELVNAQVLFAERKERQLPGRNFHFTKTFLKLFRRWPNDDKGFLREVAATREAVLSCLENDDSYELDFHASDAETLVLTNLVAQGQLRVVSTLPERNDDFDAPWPKLTAWGLGDADSLYNSHEFDISRSRFPVSYEKTPAFASGHGLTAQPVPMLPTAVDGEQGQRLPLWIDIHGNLVSRFWELTVHSVLHVIAYRTGVTSKGIEKAHEGKLWLWEIQMR